MRTFDKDPYAVLDYEWDWSTWLGGDTIQTRVFTVSPSGALAVDSNAEADGVVTAWISGGVENATYLVTCAIETIAGRKEKKSALFNLVPK